MFENNIKQKIKPNIKEAIIKKNILTSKFSGIGYKVTATKCRLLTIKMVSNMRRINRIVFFNKLKNFFIKFSINSDFIVNFGYFLCN